MGAREQNRVVSIHARPSSWQIARRPWLRAIRGVRTATDIDPDEAIAAHATETSLYRSDLDLLILDQHDQVAAYGLFWFDPQTATGLVEPMRTETHPPS